MIDLDAMMEVEECAAWMKLSVPEVRAKSKGRKSPIPAFRINCRVIRYHPRTIISKLADDAGVKFEVIAASFGEKTT